MTGTLRLALALAILALACVACGGDDDSPSASSSPVLTPTATSSSPAPTPPDGQAQTVIDLASAAPKAVVDGPGTGEFLSDLPPLVTGDFNADGLDDVLLGARFADGSSGDRADAGAAYVIFGHSPFPATIDLQGQAADVVVHGASAGANLGFSALTADLNADGIDDMIVGAPFESSGDAAGQKGAVYIFFGGADFSSIPDLGPSAASVTIIGPTASSFFGDSLAAGDANGDGAADLLVGATFDAHGGTQVGAGYLFFGSAGWPSFMLTAAGDYSAAFFGIDEFDEVGDSVAMGDLNGDGLADVILTAEAADGPDNSRQVSGEVHVYFGSPGLSGDFEISAGADLAILGADAQDTLGFSLAAGDLDGDGIDDLVMGARLDDGPGNSRSRVGAAYILRGESSLPSVIDLASPSDVIALYGAGDADLTGYVTVADAAGDAALELIIGSPFADGPDEQRPDAGTLYLFDSGTASAFPPASYITDQFLRAIVFGAADDDRAGAAAAAGDLDGDGQAELLILATGVDSGGRADAGRLYVLTLP